MHRTKQGGENRWREVVGNVGDAVGGMQSARDREGKGIGR